MAVESIFYSVSGISCRGALIWEEGVKASRPLLLMAPNWRGVIKLAIEAGQMLAAEGYVVFVADMFGEGIGDVSVRERVAMPGGGPVVHPDARMVGLRVGKGMDHIAEREQRPACPGRSHFRLEGVPLGLRRDRIGGAVHRENGGFYVTLVGGLRGRQGPVHGYDRLNVRAGAREIQDIEAAEAETHGSTPGDVADGTPIGLPRQRVERRRDAPAHAWDVRHEWPQKLHGVFRPDRAVAFAEHVGDEDDVALAR